MKTRFFLVMIFFVLGCNHNKKSSQDSKDLSNTDTSSGRPNFKTVEQMEKDRESLLDSNYSYLGKMLDTILKAANQRIQEHSFSGKIDTSAFGYKDMYATYEFGDIFSKDKKHLLVKRFINEYNNYSGSLYSDIYLFRNNSFEKVAADTASESFEENFEDVNCDGFMDYVVNSYSGAGCCPRSVDNGYLYKPQNGHFVFVDFFNRESICPKKFFYETSYGYSVDIEVYKYRWAGLKKVLIESFGPTFISWNTNTPPKTYTKTIYPSRKKITLKNAPGEYRKLKIFDYFKIK
jgi:hypothetical protein